MDARVPHADNFENGGCYGDTLEVWALVNGDTWTHLDTFTVNDGGTALVGSETGQEIDASMSELEWSGGDLDDADSVMLYMYSDISASNEEIVFDNLSISVCEEVPVDNPDGGGDDCGQYAVSYDEFMKLADDDADQTDDEMDDVLL